MSWLTTVLAVSNGSSQFHPPQLVKAAADRWREHHGLVVNCKSSVNSEYGESRPEYSYTLRRWHLHSDLFTHLPTIFQLQFGTIFRPICDSTRSHCCHLDKNWSSICLSHERTWGILFKSRYRNVRITIIIIIIITTHLDACSSKGAHFFQRKTWNLKLLPCWQLELYPRTNWGSYHASPFMKRLDGI